MSSERVELASTPDTVRWGRLPSATATPVAHLADGGVVVVETVSHEGILPDQGGDPVAFFGRFGIPPEQVLDDAKVIAAGALPRDDRRDGPHVVTGPVAVDGARPGDLLCVEVLALERRTGYGIVSNRHGRGVLAGEFPLPGADGMVPPVVCHLARVAPEGGRGILEDPRGRTIRFALGEFLGLWGVAPAEEEERSSTPPGPFGGNLDVAHLGVGAVLGLPVQVEGGLFYTGDPHFAQGNGEVALTAFEAPLRATLRLWVERGATARRLVECLGHPIGETAASWVAIGLGASLDEAMAAAVRQAVGLVGELTGLAPETVLAYLSAAADFEVSQAVNGVRGVQCIIAKADLEEAGCRLSLLAGPGGSR